MLVSSECSHLIPFAAPEGRMLRLGCDISRWSWTITILEGGEVLAYELYQQSVAWSDLCHMALGQEYRVQVAIGDLVLRKVGDKLAIWIETEEQPDYLAADGLIGLVAWSPCIDAMHELERARTRMS
jgi:hypothetical protein